MQKRRLSKVKTSSLLNIRINYGGEKFRFNLFQELQITEEKLNREIKNQPSYYGFLLLLSKKLNTEFQSLKEERKKVGGQLFLQAKTEKAQGNRPYNDDMAKAFMESHKDYVAITKQCIKAKDDAEVIGACVIAFEQRGSLIQTISSNKRNEKF